MLLELPCRETCSFKNSRKSKRWNAAGEPVLAGTRRERQESFLFLPAARVRNTSQIPCYTTVAMDRRHCYKLLPGLCLVSWCFYIFSEERWSISHGCFSHHILVLACVHRGHRKLSTAKATYTFYIYRNALKGGCAMLKAAQIMWNYKSITKTTKTTFHDV